MVNELKILLVSLVQKYTNVFCDIYSCGVYLTLFWTFKLQYIVDKTFGSEMYMTQEYTCLQT